mmetsp:Transcript_30751/g.53955  ORF Transcript_30751/g.53955 Transcript_30751/m.53955 type:complete len:93 (-) Transcript_30751:103-381(-)
MYNPIPFIEEAQGLLIRVHLSGSNFKIMGYLAKSDDYINLKVINASEYYEDTKTAYIGDIFIKCSSVLYVEIVGPYDKNITIPLVKYRTAYL